MNDKEYELKLKDVDCCQNCVHFSLGMHFDGCPEGWCNRETLKIVNRAAAVCDKYKKRRTENE